MAARINKERRGIVRFFYEAGLRGAEICRVAGYNATTVGRDIDSFAGEGISAPAEKGEGLTFFQKIIELYAQLESARWSGSGVSATESAVLKILQRSSEITETEFFLGGIVAACDVLCKPIYDPAREGYYQLYRAVFGSVHRGVPMREAKIPPSYFLEILRGGAPMDRSAFFQMFANCETEEARKEVQPVWGENVYRFIDLVLDTLDGREATILRKRFGIPSGPGLTLQQIAEAMGGKCTRERVRQIEAKALRRLRHPDRNLKVIRTGKEEMISVAIAEFYKKRGEIDPAVNEMPIEELSCTVRTYNYLRSINVHNVGELAKMTEPYLRKQVGKKTLREIKDLLQELGLQLKADVPAASVS